MSVYVDPLFEYGGSKSFRWERSCHLYADTLDELHAFAKRIGMRREWYQSKLALPHYDLTARRRSVAVRSGAVEHSRREMVRFVRARRDLVLAALDATGIRLASHPVAAVEALFIDGEVVDDLAELRKALHASARAVVHGAGDAPAAGLFG